MGSSKDPEKPSEERDQAEGPARDGVEGPVSLACRLRVRARSTCVLLLLTCIHGD